MRILVVEDNVKLAASLRKGLEQESYAVDVCGDGAEAFDRLRSGPAGYDLLVLDVMLPGVDGLTLCRKLRARGNRVPVLLLTARDAVPDRVAGLDAGADDYLPDAARRRVFVSGPPGIVDSARAALRSAGVHPWSIRTDCFPGYPSSEKAGGELRTIQERLAFRRVALEQSPAPPPTVTPRTRDATTIGRPRPR